MSDGNSVTWLNADFKETESVQTGQTSCAIQFLGAESCQATEIHWRMCMEWQWKFHSVWDEMNDEARPFVLLQYLKEAVHADRHQSNPAKFDMSIDTVHTIMRCMGYHKS